MIELIVSRYNEKLNWLLEDPFLKYSATIYNKGPEKNFFVKKKSTDYYDPHTSRFKFRSLPNVGRESHTFLFHIIENYDNLSDILVFLPGSCMNDIKEHKTIEVMNKVIDTNDSVIFGKWFSNVKNDLKNFSISRWQGTTRENISILEEKDCAPSQISRPFGKWYEHYFNSLVINVVSYTSIFAISKIHIQQHSIEHYKSLLESVSTHSNPEDGHFMERAWVAVFSPLPEKCLYTARPIESNSNSNKINNLLKQENNSMSRMLRMYSQISNNNNNNNDKSNLEHNDKSDLVTTKKQKLDG